MNRVDIAALALRLCFGLSMTWHGINKRRGPRGIAGTANWFATIGMTRPLLNARAASTTEIAAGLALAAGLVTPLASAAIVGLMVVAIVTVHWKVGYFIFLPNQGWEYCGAIVVVAGVIPLIGGDRFTLDSVLGLDVAPGSAWSTAWAWCALPLGVVAALCQLSLFWRPSRPIPSS